mmetsp:Transcript_93947/g.223552  ORF Transcript_93947/g.223552 Transcript_93947/m.223552 type:complete len:256 (+) Transcript_93947:1116-1883(+)
MELRVVINDSDDHSGVVHLVASLVPQLLGEDLKGPTLVGALPRHMPRHVRRVVGGRDEGELPGVLLLKLPGLVLGLHLALLEGEADRQVGPAKAVVHEGMQSHPQAFHGCLVGGDHHNVKQVMPLHLGHGVLGPNPSGRWHGPLDRWRVVTAAVVQGRAGRLVPSDLGTPLVPKDLLEVQGVPVSADVHPNLEHSPGSPYHHLNCREEHEAGVQHHRHQHAPAISQGHASDESRGAPVDGEERQNSKRLLDDLVA